MREFQAFLTRLAGALRQQGEILERTKAERDLELCDWRRAAQRADMVDHVVRRREDEERRAAERAEQRESDDRSLRRSHRHEPQRPGRGRLVEQRISKCRDEPGEGAARLAGRRSARLARGRRPFRRKRCERSARRSGLGRRTVPAVAGRRRFPAPALARRSKLPAGEPAPAGESATVRDRVLPAGILRADIGRALTGSADIRLLGCTAFGLAPCATVGHEAGDHVGYPGEPASAAAGRCGAHCAGRATGRRAIPAPPGSRFRHRRSRRDAAHAPGCPAFAGGTRSLAGESDIRLVLGHTERRLRRREPARRGIASVPGVRACARPRLIRRIGHCVRGGGSARSRVRSCGSGRLDAPACRKRSGRFGLERFHEHVGRLRSESVAGSRSRRGHGYGGRRRGDCRSSRGRIIRPEFGVGFRGNIRHCSRARPRGAPARTRAARRAHDG